MNKMSIVKCGSSESGAATEEKSLLEKYRDAREEIGYYKGILAGFGIEIGKFVPGRRMTKLGIYKAEGGSHES